jgi:LDH2 family malate/lactate/ureidoglycolate dehydrogenase
MSDAAASVPVGDTGDELVDPERLRQFASEVLERVGMGDGDARVMADSFVWADLHGLPFVGIRRLPECVGRLQKGGTDPGDGTGLSIVGEREAFAVVDAMDTFAQVTGVRAMELAVDKARSTGVGIVSVRNTTSAGALGYLAIQAAERGMVGMAINDTAPVMSTWGGSAGALGAQPFAVASPAGRHPPLLLDMTNSVMSMVRIYEHQTRDETIPAGVALAADGQPTTDPASAIRGTLLPAGHRGYALALMWEVLTGVLAGGEAFGNDVGLPGQLERPMKVSLFLMAIDPTASMAHETFAARVDQLIDHVHAAPTHAEADDVRVPGERSQAIAARRAQEGLPIPDEVVRSLQTLGVQVGVSW